MFKDRNEAGMRLASVLKKYKDREGVIVLALPRGGVVTGYEIARSLNAPLDIVIVRKIGAPLQPELGIGAISETGATFLNKAIIYTYGIPKDYIDREIERQKEEISRRVKFYRKGKKLPDLKGKTVILVDDGVATGGTMKAAINTLKEEKLSKLVVAIPVAPPDTANEFKQIVDEFICLETPMNFMAVGAHYRDFTQVLDEEVIELLEKSMAEHSKT